MKYFCIRTSFFGTSEQPCEEAFKESDSWFVQFNSLEELNAFINKYGSVVIEKFCGQLTLEIYDDYRE